MITSSVAIANTQENENQIELNTTHQGTANGARGDVVWDNGMDYDGLGASQKDDQYPFYAECADDFHFDEDTEVCDVHWIGGYWNDDELYNQVHWPWEITFYYDDGSGTKPGNVFAGPFEFDNTEYTETFLEENPPPNENIYYEFSVDLRENILFPACEKFWLVIRGVGFFPPQSGWGYHLDPIKLHEALLRSELLGFPDWTPWSEVDPPNARDMCFQLTTKQGCEPCVDVEKYVRENPNQDWVDADTEDTALDVLICTEVTFKIVIHNCGDVPLENIVVKDRMHDSLKFISADPEPDVFNYEPPIYYMEWKIPGPLEPCETKEIYIVAHVEGPECSYDFNHVLVEAQGCGNTVEDEDWCYVHAKRKGKSVNMPFITWLESHPNMFPLLQIMLKLIGLF
jgi:hypothetical protein